MLQKSREILSQSLHSCRIHRVGLAVQCSSMGSGTTYDSAPDSNLITYVRALNPALWSRSATKVDSVHTELSSPTYCSILQSSM